MSSDSTLLFQLRTQALTFLSKAQTAAQNTHEMDLSFFCKTLEDLIATELQLPDESTGSLFSEIYDYYTRT